MAGKLVDRVVSPFQKRLRAPGGGPSGRVGEGQLVGKGVGGGAGQPLDQLQVGSRAPVGALR